MHGTPGRAHALAAVPAAPPPPAFTVWAEVAAWYETHQDGQPPLCDRTLSFQVQGRTHAEKMENLWEFARFLQVQPQWRNEVLFVQRRFGTAGSSITLDAHYTPDPDRAFRLMQQRDAARALTPAGAA
jgi:hypothetical protein